MDKPITIHNAYFGAQLDADLAQGENKERILIQRAVAAKITALCSVEGLSIFEAQAVIDAAKQLLMASPVAPVILQDDDQK